MSEIINYYVQDKDIVESLTEEVSAIIRDFQESTSFGNIATICVPKDEIQKVAYFSHLLGFPCDCDKNIDPDLALKVAQNRDQFVGQGIKDIHWERSSQDLLGMKMDPKNKHQWRLLAHELTQENGVKIFLNSGLKKEEFKELKNKLKELALKTVGDS